MDMMQGQIQVGAPLVLLPGLMCDQRVFAPQRAAVSGATGPEGYGITDSLAGMAAKVLRAAPERFSLLGHSMGARVALEVLRAAPERVERLALVSTGVHPVRPGEAEKRHALRDIGRREGMEALVDAWLPPMVTPARRYDATFMEPIRQMCVEAGLPVFEAQIKALLNRPHVEELLMSVTIPTLIAVGVHDAWSPVEQHAEIAAMVPGARLVEIEGAGHMLPLEEPDALNAAIFQWLAEPSR